MNVFVLSTGRCGTLTFGRACSHITNFTSGHETRSGDLAVDRFPYPRNHIEVDNRLSWMLGLLEEAHGDDAFYVHMTRNRAEVVQSYVRRASLPVGIMKAYSRGILITEEIRFTNEQYAGDMIDTVTANIVHFLRDKTSKMEFPLEDWREKFPEFWEAVRAEGDFEAAMSEWTVRHNVGPQADRAGPVRRILRQARRRLASAVGNTV